MADGTSPALDPAAEQRMRDAAPALYEALRRLTAEAKADGMASRPGWDCWVSMADAALAQVEGEAPAPVWQTIESAPRDGTVIELAWLENEQPQEVYPMRWGHIQRNGLFPGKIGMWVTPDGSLTWNDHPTLGGGPTHWRLLPLRSGDGRRG